MKAVMETLYRHVYHLQGVRHPITGYDALSRARDYIVRELQPYCDQVCCEEFWVKGFDRPFTNIDARIGTGDSGPVLCLGSHYDTVYNSPGANDNASAVAALLYLAQALAPLRESVHLRLLFFSLEEGNPALDAIVLGRGCELGIRDAKGCFTSLQYSQEYRLFQKAFARARSQASACGEQYQRAYEEVASGLTPLMARYLGEITDFCRAFRDPMGYGERALLGSTNWMERHRAELNPCRGMINLDPIAYASSRPCSHVIPHEMRQGIEFCGVDLENQTGDFIAVIGNRGSEALQSSFFQGARRHQLPYAFVSLPIPYQEAARQAHYVLLSDHSAFWKADLPVLFLTDTGAEMRYFFEHTPADTIQQLNFDFFARVVLSVGHAVSACFGLQL